MLPFYSAVACLLVFAIGHSFLSLFVLLVTLCSKVGCLNTLQRSSSSSYTSWRLRFCYLWKLKSASLTAYNSTTVAIPPRLNVVIEHEQEVIPCHSNATTDVLLQWLGVEISEIDFSIYWLQHLYSDAAITRIWFLFQNYFHTTLTDRNHLIPMLGPMICLFLQSFDAVGWAAGRASGL